MLRIRFDLPGNRPPGETAVLVKALIDGAARGCALLWPRWNLPPLYKAGIRYQREPQHGTGLEDFCLPPITFHQKWGDCDDLVIYRVAELIAHGEAAECKADWINGELHVLVRRGDKSIEDPSIALGALG